MVVLSGQIAQSSSSQIVYIKYSNSLRGFQYNTNWPSQILANIADYAFYIVKMHV